MDILLQQLIEAAGADNVRTMEPMGPHVTFRAGGKADYFVSPGGERELAEVIRACRRQGTPFCVLGNGSNLLVGDLGYRGVIIQLGEPWSGCRFDGTQAAAGAGILLSRLAKEAWRQGLSGLEAASGIPGTLGGALVMNAGAYGGQMADLIVRTHYLDSDGKPGVIEGDAHGFGYRESIFKAHPDWTILRAELRLAPGSPAGIREKMQDYAQRRREKQPLEFPSAGSTFKRPEGYFAGKLIQDSGLMGYAVGGAQVSEKHAGFLINRGGATCADMLALIEYVQKTVLQNFGVELQCEVRLI